MSYYIVLIFILMLGIDLSYLFKRGFGQTAALANFILIFMLYLGGLFLDMRLAMYIFISGIILLTGYTGYKVLRTHDVGGIKAVFSNPAFYVYAALGIALGIVFLNFTTLGNGIGDEKAHWALVVKNMFAYDNFGNIGDTTTMFNQYVPATGIFLYAFQIFNKSFSEGALYAAFDLLMLSMLLPVFEIFKNKLSLPCILTFVIVVVEVVLYNVQAFHSVLVDVVLAVMMAYVYLAYRLDKDRADGFTVVNIAFACFVLTLTKSSGLALVAFALIFVVIDMFTINKVRTKEFFQNKLNFVYVLLPVVLIAFAKLSWSWYIDFYNVRVGWNASEMTLHNISEWLTNPNEYQATVTSLFLKTFFLGNGYGVQVPQILGTLLTVGACALLWYKTKNKSFVVAQGIMTVVMVVGYGIYLMLLYIFSFAYAEGLSLASYCRYMSSIWLALALIYIYQLAELYAVEWSEKDILPAKLSAKIKPIAYPIFAAVLGVFSLSLSIGGYFTCVKSVAREEAPYLAWMQTVKNLDNNDSVYIVVSDENGKGAQVHDYMIMRFIAAPMQTSGFNEGGTYADGRDAQVWYTGNPFSMNDTVEAFKEEVDKYTYIYLFHIQDGFEEKFGECFKDEISDNTLYKVIEGENGDISFVYAK